MGVSRISDHIQIKIKMPNPSQELPAQSKIPIQSKIKIANSNQEPPASPKAPNEDLKDMFVLCTFKIKIESQNLDHGYIKDQ